MGLTIDRAALEADLENLARITDPARPYTRRSFSDRFLEGRAFLTARFKEAGLEVRIDTAGNLIGRWPAADPWAPVIMTGSHSDTVPDGGRFDGIAGVLSGLAAIRAMKAAGYGPRHMIEVVDFLAEEPSEWGLSCVGSRGMAGALGARELALEGPGGERLADAITRMGGDGTRIDEARRNDVAAFFELHIEQGPVLESGAVPVGIVSGIAGIGRVKVRFSGVAGHAGTVPMEGRRDAALAMARFVLAVRDTAAGMREAGHFTATAGILQIEPGGANVIPGAAETLLDIRAENDRAMDQFLETLPALAQSAAAAEGCGVETLETISRTFAVQCNAQLRGDLEAAAEGLGEGWRPLASGAGHDAAFVSRFAPAAMIFVPSRGGLSHCPEEWTAPEQVAVGADVLLNALCRRDQRRHAAPHPRLESNRSIGTRPNSAAPVFSDEGIPK